MQQASTTSSAWLLLSLLQLQLCSTTATGALQAQNLSLSPTEDATIYRSQTDYDTLNQLVFTGQSSSPELNSLLKFDLTFMNHKSSSKLNRVQLHLCNSLLTGGAFDPLMVNIYGVSPSYFYGGGDWSESSATWYHSPEADVSGGKAKFVESHMDDDCIWHTFSVLDLARSSLENPTMNDLTLRIVGNDYASIGMYASKEFQQGKVAPRLDVYFGQGEDNAQQAAQNQQMHDTMMSSTIHTSSSGVYDSELCATPIYGEGALFTAKDRVLNQDAIYECNVPSWCSMRGYEPGQGSYWKLAWTLLHESLGCPDVPDDPTSDGDHTPHSHPLNAVDVDGEECPRSLFGWAASPDCSSYYWCTHGLRSSMTYSCVDGQKFDVSKSACSLGYTCPVAAAAPTATSTISKTAIEHATAIAVDYPAPTSYPTKLGPAVYYGDFRTTSCQNINDSLQVKPDWMREEDMFKSKEECCKEMFSWLPLANCLGPGFVESNYLVGSRSPTLNPTMSPTTVPSSRPSFSVPSSSPSLPREVDSNSIHQHSTMTPPTTEDELKATSTSQNQADTNFLVDLLGWSNADMLPEPEGSTADIFSSTSLPVEGESQISELTLPIVSDATISRNRPSANFGANSALAVDGGAPQDASSEKEKLDSLLKFDVGMIDSTRNIESAVLRVYALSNCLGTTFTATVNSDWNHEKVTWDDAPSVRGGVLFGAIKEVRQNEWFEIDITRAMKWLDKISPNGSFLSIRMASTENSRCLYSSMESGGANAPGIVVKYLTHDVADPPAPGQFILLEADADSTISASNPTTVLSKEPSLKVEFELGKIHDTLIRFDLSETVGTNPRSAILSLFTEMSCPSAGTFTTIADDFTWDESTITWSTAHEAGDGDGDGDQLNGVMIGTFGAVNKNRWYGFDVSEAIRVAILTEKKHVTFRISGNAETCMYSSKERGRGPKLMVSF